MPNLSHAAKRIRSDQKRHNRIRKAHPIRRPQPPKQRRIPNRILHRRAHFLNINMHIMRYNRRLHRRRNRQPNRPSNLPHSIDKRTTQRLVALWQTMRREQRKRWPHRVRPEDRKHHGWEAVRPVRGVGGNRRRKEEV